MFCEVFERRGPTQCSFNIKIIIDLETKLLLCACQGETLIKSVHPIRNCTATLVSGIGGVFHWLILVIYCNVNINHEFFFSFFSLCFVVVVVLFVSLFVFWLLKNTHS